MCGLKKKSGDTVAQIKVESSVAMEEKGMVTTFVGDRM